MSLITGNCTHRNREGSAPEHTSTATNSTDHGSPPVSLQPRVPRPAAVLNIIATLAWFAIVGVETFSIVWHGWYDTSTFKATDSGAITSLVFWNLVGAKLTSQILLSLQRFRLKRESAELVLFVLGTLTSIAIHYMFSSKSAIRSPTICTS